MTALLDKLAVIDGNLLIGIQHALNADWLTPIMKGFSFFGNAGWASILFCLILICIKKTRKLGILCAGSVLLTFVCCSGILKPLVDRARPWEIIDGVNVLLPDPGDASFPSGHTSNSMAVAFSFWLNTRLGKVEGQNDWDEGVNIEWILTAANRRKLHNWSYVALVFALLVGLSRIYLGMHFPGDVLCGMLVAMICSLIVYKINIKLELRNDIINQQ